jgi:hypothetical protein
MVEALPPLPFKLDLRGDGTWRSRWAEERLFIVVGGTEEAPAAPLVETLRDVVSRWAEVKDAIATFVRGLPSGHHVPLDPATRGGFSAGTCGFDQELAFDSIAVRSLESPRRVVVTFYTGYPDGYATYALVLERGVPTEVSAFAS